MAMFTTDFIDFFKELSQNNSKKWFDQNKRIPAEFNDAAEKQPLLFNKAFYYYAKLDAKLILDPGLADIFMDYYLAAKPMREFLISSVSNG